MTWLSTVRSVASESSPQTSSTISMRETISPRLLGQDLEHEDVVGGQLDGARGPGGGERAKVEAHAAPARDLRARRCGRGAAQQRAHARQQLAHRERLGQIVVGAQLEAHTRSTTSPLAVRMSTGSWLPSRAGREHVEAGAPGQHEVQDDQIRPEARAPRRAPRRLAPPA